MKLYTEEEIRRTFGFGLSEMNFKGYLNAMTPVELPSGIVKIEIQHQYHSSKEFYSDAGFVNCTKEQYESIKTEIPTCPLNKLVKITPIELPSDEEIEKAYQFLGDWTPKEIMQKSTSFELGAKWLRDKIQGGSK